MTVATGTRFVGAPWDSNALLDGARVAGLAPRQSDQLSVWTTYLASNDADATAAKIREHGGTVVVEPMPIEDFGRSPAPWPGPN